MADSKEPEKMRALQVLNNVLAWTVGCFQTYPVKNMLPMLAPAKL